MIATLVDDRIAVEPFVNDASRRALVVAAGPDVATVYPEGSVIICDWEAGIPLQLGGRQLRIIESLHVLATTDAADAADGAPGRGAIERAPIEWGRPDA